MPEMSLSKANLGDELKEEIALYRVLKPYIARCLTLNHDINNPLAGIIGYVEYILMDEDKISPGHQQSLQQIMKCAERIKALVDELHDEKIALNEKVDLSSVLDTYGNAAGKSD
ncbi:MAG TPA: histidine kinase dimerization/phospho-acceptor domain-containing protein [Acidobacteriota bacterium]|nr:histidine kinase dimerization/phospho-acceptor domain-containing protein [Acidobacteriota bacterium]